MTEEIRVDGMTKEEYITEKMKANKMEVKADGSVVFTPVTREDAEGYWENAVKWVVIEEAQRKEGIKRVVHKTVVTGVSNSQDQIFGCFEILYLMSKLVGDIVVKSGLDASTLSESAQYALKVLQWGQALGVKADDAIASGMSAQDFENSLNHPPTVE